jgi:pyrroloquinoline quinone biosynthesis protein B
MKTHFNLYLPILLTALFFYRCHTGSNTKIPHKPNDTSGVSLIILGNIQDGGAPHIGCKKQCCKSLFTNPNPQLKVVSLGLIDFDFKKTWLIEATPDIAIQLKALKQYSHFNSNETPDGIFITHAHIGHYAGLMYLGKEAMGSKKVPVYAMPRMKYYLESNGPWQQLVKLNNMSLFPLQEEIPYKLSQTLSVTPFMVPHRDEYSETVGFKIKGPHKSVLFIPDINKWAIWKKNIIDEISKVDYAFIDATFYDSLEIQSRKISEIPHPFVIESVKLFKNLPLSEKNKIYFIHLNHTNPLINENSVQCKSLNKLGFHVARFRDIIKL